MVLAVDLGEAMSNRIDRVEWCLSSDPFLRYG